MAACRSRVRTAVRSAACSAEPSSKSRHRTDQRVPKGSLTRAKPRSVSAVMSTFGTAHQAAELHPGVQAEGSAWCCRVRLDEMPVGAGNDVTVPDLGFHPRGGPTAAGSCGMALRLWGSKA